MPWVQCCMQVFIRVQCTYRSIVPWNSSSPQTAPVSTAPVASDIEKSTAALALEKREPIVMKYSSKSGKKGGKKVTEDDGEKNLVYSTYSTCTTSTCMI